MHRGPRKSREPMSVRARRQRAKQRAANEHFGLGSRARAKAPRQACLAEDQVR